MAQKILLVDDEQNVLDGLQRLFRKEFSLETACGGEAGLALMASSGPFAVVVSDMRMPGMNGIQFLMAARERHPETVRLMLTGNSDIKTAIDAVNEGHVFRFLTKPCPDEILRGALRAGIAQYELITAEKELLEKTLHGGVKVLTEILALVNPAAFSRATRVHRTVQHMSRELALRDAWRYELAAMLSQVGCVALDTETVEAVYAGAELPAADQERFRKHPAIAYELLSKIPRLELVARMVAGQLDPSDKKGYPAGGTAGDPGALGAGLLRIAVDFDRLLLHGLGRAEAIGKLKNKPDEYYGAAVAALESLPAESVTMVTDEITPRELTVGMILDQDLRSANGMLMVARNQEITHPLLERIRNLYQKAPMANKIRVKIPRRGVPPAPEKQDQAEAQPTGGVAR